LTESSFPPPPPSILPASALLPLHLIRSDSEGSFDKFPPALIIYHMNFFFVDGQLRRLLGERRGEGEREERRRR